MATLASFLHCRVKVWQFFGEFRRIGASDGYQSMTEILLESEVPLSKVLELGRFGECAMHGCIVLIFLYGCACLQGSERSVPLQSEIPRKGQTSQNAGPLPNVLHCGQNRNFQMDADEQGLLQSTTTNATCRQSFQVENLRDFCMSH